MFKSKSIIFFELQNNISLPDSIKQKATGVRGQQTNYRLMTGQFITHRTDPPHNLWIALPLPLSTPSLSAAICR